MRWILVNMTAAAALVAGFLGYWMAAVILLVGVAAHTSHWFFKERGQAPYAGSADAVDSNRDSSTR